MLLAANYSPPLAALVRQGRVEVDLFKCPDWPDLVAQAAQLRPCYVHFPFLAGKGDVRHADWRAVESFLETTETAYVNIHIAPCARDFGDMELTTRDPADTHRLIDAMVDDIGLLVERFGPDRVAAENVMWDPVEPWFIPEPAIRTETITEVIRETNCQMVLDIAHASIAARHLGLDEREYIEALPVDRLLEMHITGVRDEEPGRWSDHFPMTDRDWLLARWALRQVHEGRWPRPRVVAFEYGGVGPSYEWRSDSQVIEEQLPAMAALTKEPPASA